ncbi:hypothetical protein [Aquimarina sp. AU474]|uniref:hypothetical protein n=1 Tax=Aquimarina sp. AU474 TaxID=2108529 RepID=UPI000D696F9B|nr:hypothetical protein [Aquimarina sp. AU474]
MKNLHAPKVMFYLCYLIVIVISTFFDKSYLKIILPITLLALIIYYIKDSPRINMFFILSIIALMVNDFLLYTDMISNFSKICILISSYLVFTSLSLKSYVVQTKQHWSKIISASLLISLALIIYLIFSISELVLHRLPGAIPYIVMAVIPLLVYIAISYYIYISDVYVSGIRLLISACLCIFIITLAPINELFYSSRVFIIFNTTGHILGLYLFMKFLMETDPAVVPDKVPKYV